MNIHDQRKYVAGIFLDSSWKSRVEKMKDEVIATIYLNHTEFIKGDGPAQNTQPDNQLRLF